MKRPRLLSHKGVRVWAPGCCFSSLLFGKMMGAEHAFGGCGCVSVEPGCFLFVLVCCASERCESLWCLDAGRGTGGNRSDRMLEQNNEDALSNLFYWFYIARGVNCGIESTPVGVATYHFAVVTFKRLIPWSRCVMVTLRLQAAIKHTFKDCYKLLFKLYC
jgi:hypothetical protein